MMTSPINRMRKIVSKKKRRYREDGFDLDLTYILPNVIAMGYPAESYEGVYRNSISEVSRFLSSKHGDKFFIYNLCVENERQYDGVRFNNNVCSEFKFEDHNPPTMKMIFRFCEHASERLKQMSDQTLVIHCKAGKGRTGVMSSCFLMYYYPRQYNDPLQTLRFYAKQRTLDEKGVTIPSQRRYVEYFGHLLNTQLSYTSKKLIFTGLLITHEQNQVLQSSLSYTVKSADNRVQYKSFEILLERDPILHQNLSMNYSVLGATHKYFAPSLSQQCRIPLEDDVLIEIFVTKPKRTKPEKLCQFWFNTFFLLEQKFQELLSAGDEQQWESNLGTLSSCLIAECGHKYLYTLTKKDIDILHKDKHHRVVPSSLTVSVLFDYIPTPPSISPNLIRADQSYYSSEKSTNGDLKLIESNNGSSFIIVPADKSVYDNQYKINNQANGTAGNESNKNKNNNIKTKHRKNRSVSSKTRTLILYPNSTSDWDSTDSESGINGATFREEPKNCQTHC